MNSLATSSDRSSLYYGRDITANPTFAEAFSFPLPESLGGGLSFYTPNLLQLGVSLIVIIITITITTAFIIKHKKYSPE